MWPSGQPFRPLAIDAVYSIPVHEDLSAVESYRENFVEVGPFFFPVTSLASAKKKYNKDICRYKQYFPIRLNYNFLFFFLSC